MESLLLALTEGTEFPEGTIRTWKGGEYKKVNGKWEKQSTPSVRSKAERIVGKVPENVSKSLSHLGEYFDTKKGSIKVEPRGDMKTYEFPVKKPFMIERSGVVMEVVGLSHSVVDDDAEPAQTSVMVVRHDEKTGKKLTQMVPLRGETTKAQQSELYHMKQKLSFDEE